VAPLEPQEKVLVSEEFLETVHGEIACVDCHAGNPGAADKANAHKGMEPYPALKNPEKACGECHEDIVKTGSKSLHTTLSTFPTILKTRADMSKWGQIDDARSKHCAGCHTSSCGGCHVSRPKFAKKGFINGHVFQKHSDPINQCTACHGSRVGMEYYGMRGEGDVHVTKHDMDCVSCHKAEEMHADGTGLPGRYHLKEMVRCETCHQGLENGSVRDHTIHIGKVQCQVCHSQSYVNCYSCHTGRDKEGLYYFTNKKEVEDMKIGLNYDKGAPDANYEYMLVRHIPVDPDLFKFYVKDALTNFDKVPNWKRTSPHNIQRKTWQNANCNNCHGNRDLFLSSGDLLDYEKAANKTVIVSDSKVPQAIKATQPFSVDVTGVKTGMVVDAQWLHKNIGKKGVVLIDARPEGAYKKGHIEGAISLNPLAAGFRTDSDDDNPLTLVEFEDVAEILGNAGIGATDHVVVYDKAGPVSGFFLWVLEYAGVQNVSYLKGGIEGWHEAGYHVTDKATAAKAKTFDGKPNPQFVADNAFVQANLDKAGVVVLDARIITQAKGMITHGAAERGGHIPGSINLPLSTLYMDNGALKSPDELLWILKKNGITTDKTVVTTCNTGQLAGSAFFMLRYLGFDDVKVHDESWISWCAEE
jgi:thiosulfate/3-mercaptopyruvate sulfurtransferase